jgi:hypothetical protein
MYCLPLTCKLPSYDAQVYRYAASLLECQLARCGLATKHAPWPRDRGTTGSPAGTGFGLSEAAVGIKVSLPKTVANAAALGLLDG